MKLARKKLTEGMRQKENGVWELQETINGKRRSFSSLNPSEVIRKRDMARAEGAAEKILGIQADEKPKAPLFEEVAEIYVGQVCEMKHGTQIAYRPALRRAKAYFKGMRIDEIEPYMVTQFLKSISGMAQSTVSNQKTVLNSIFQIWIDSPEWAGFRNPADLAKMPRKLKKSKRMPPSNTQVQIVKDNLDDLEALPAVVYLCTGERRGEACAIQLRDIDFEENLIDVSKSVEFIGNRPHITVTKTEAGVRTVPLLSPLKQALQQLRSMSPETYIIGLKETPVTASEYRRMWIRFWRKHGMAQPIERTMRRKRNGRETTVSYTDWKADICAHQFRHEYVCMLAEAEVPEEIAILLVGHANAKMIHEVYLALKPSMVHSARNKLNELLNTKSQENNT